ncbi:hypothetical protein E6C27_scaffold133G00280 [Cucumis melo var. makuwa]|uniref:Gag/pol protein n=1 Tax=Cucumis melo var. makuwa TaxID=1194695 RepID=A0A5A7U2X5_CUCMM|nr:hypothetical protein E6C27_scaffold133G00280 [Cucumis melo var. makuwa]
MVTTCQIMDSLQEMFKKIQKNKGGNKKHPAAASKGKRKAKVADKGKSFLYNVNERCKRNCPKYLVEKKNEKEDDHSRYGYLNLMKHKFEGLEKFKEYKVEVENLLIEIAILILNNVPSKSVSETPFAL